MAEEAIVGHVPRGIAPFAGQRHMEGDNITASLNFVERDK